MSRESLTTLRERLQTVVSIANRQGIPVSLGHVPPYKGGALDIGSSHYGYSVEVLSKPGSTGVRVLESAMSARECALYLQGMAAGLDLRRQLEHSGSIPRRIPEASEASDRLAVTCASEATWYTPAMKHLSKLHKSGRFELERAISYVERAVCKPVADDQRLRCGDTYAKPVRMAAAETLVSNAVEEFRLGNYWK